jgi:hypothetical protein
MPRLNGPGLVEELHADDTLAGIPVITMSAGTTPAGLKTIGHLAKPFEIGAMLALLFQACRSCASCDGEGPVIGSIFEARLRADQRAR